MRLSEFLAHLRQRGLADLSRSTAEGITIVHIGRADAVFPHIGKVVSIAIPAGTDPVLEPEVITSVYRAFSIADRE